MPAPNTNDFRSLIAYDRSVHVTPTNFTTTAVDYGWCARITAQVAKSPQTIWLYYQTATAPVGTAELRIETTDANGRPTGTLYHANAFATYSPAAGWNGISFASLPAAWTPGLEYCILARTTVAGTSNLLRGAVNLGSYPTCVLTSATASNRASFAENSQPMPVLSLTYDDGEQDALQCCQYPTATNYNIAGTAGVGAVFTIVDTVPTDGVDATMIRSGAGPAGDLRMMLLDAANVVIASHTISRGSLSALGTTVQCKFPWAGIQSVPPGTYRIVFDSALSVAGNCFRIRTGTARVTQLCGGAFRYTSCPDIANPVWTDSPVELAAIALRTVDRIAPAGAGGISLARAWQ